MKIFLALSLFLALTLFAFVDSDFDGVEDAQDRCPNTDFMELVDESGCTTTVLFPSYSMDIIVGVNYSDANYQSRNPTETLSNLIQFDYYYKDFSFQASTSYFLTQGSGYNERGLYDSFLGIAYQIEPFDKLSIQLGGGAIIPTYKTALNNNNTDYLLSLNWNYQYALFSLFGTYSYTQVNDATLTLYTRKGIKKIKYQDTEALSLGFGYYLSDALYCNTAFNISEGIYKNSQNIETLSVYFYYTLDAHWFSTLSYARGLSDAASRNYASLRLGYLF